MGLGQRGKEAAGILKAEEELELVDRKPSWSPFPRSLMVYCSLE